MTTVCHLLAQKSNEIWSISPGDSVFDCVKMMADKDIGSLVVIEDGRLVGIITERHYARNVVLKGEPRPRRGSARSCGLTSPASAPIIRLSSAWP